MRSRRSSVRGFVLASATALIAVGAACSKLADPPKDTPPAPAATVAKLDPVKRGEALVKLSGCNDCHTPLAFDPKLGAPVPRKDMFLAGHPNGTPAPTSSATNGEAVMGATMTAFKLPFGTVYAANLTPDVETGLGAWTEEAFVRTLRTGKHRGEADGRPILPPMPWPNLAAQSDEDLHAIWSYLRSIPAVHNEVPAPAVPPPVLAGFQKTNAQLAQNP